MLKEVFRVHTIVLESGKQFLNCKNGFRIMKSAFGASYMFVVLHTAKRNSFRHRKHGRIICGHPSNAKKLVRSKEETGSEYLRIHYLEWKLFIICKMQCHFLLDCVVTLAPPHHPSHMYFADLYYIPFTENIRTTKC